MHRHAIKLLTRQVKIYEREVERMLPLRNDEDCAKIQSLISELKNTIKILENLK